jgi:hypothetical protein
MDIYSWVRASQSWAPRESNTEQNIAIPGKNSKQGSFKFSRITPEKARAIVGHIEASSTAVIDATGWVTSREGTVDEIDTGVHVKHDSWGH